MSDSTGIDSSSSPIRVAPRLVQLDVLRGIAILMVLGHHLPLDTHKAGWLKVPLILWGTSGWSGVDLFFVLSGFLVGGLLFKEIKTRGSLDVKRFIIRRGFKIWPSYYLCILAQFAWMIKVDHKEPGFALYCLRCNALHYQNYAGTGWHMWSLAVEEHFYLLLPSLLFLLTASGKRPLPRWFPLAGFVVMIFSLACRFAVGWNHPWDPNKTYFLTHTRMDSLFVGVLLAYSYHFYPQLFEALGRQRKLLLSFSALGFAPFTVFEMHEHQVIWTFGYSWLYLVFGSLLIAIVTAGASEQRWKLFFESWPIRLVAWVGTYSYSIYLWHLYLQRGMQKWWVKPVSHIPGAAQPLVTVILFVLGSVGLGVLLGKMVETPMLKIRDRLFTARSAAI